MTVNKVSVLASGFFTAAEGRGEDSESDQGLIQHPSNKKRTD